MHYKRGQWTTSIIETLVLSNKTITKPWFKKRGKCKLHCHKNPKRWITIIPLALYDESVLGFMSCEGVLVHLMMTLKNKCGLWESILTIFNIICKLYKKSMDHIAFISPCRKAYLYIFTKQCLC